MEDRLSNNEQEKLDQLLNNISAEDSASDDSVFPQDVPPVPPVDMSGAVDAAPLPPQDSFPADTQFGSVPPVDAQFADAPPPPADMPQAAPPMPSDMGAAPPASPDPQFAAAPSPPAPEAVPPAQPQAPTNQQFPAASVDSMPPAQPIPGPQGPQGSWEEAPGPVPMQGEENPIPGPEQPFQPSVASPPIPPIQPPVQDPLSAPAPPIDNPMNAPIPDPLVAPPPMPEPPPLHETMPSPWEQQAPAPVHAEISEADLPEAIDVLAAIAVVDPDMENAANAANAIDRVRTESKLQQGGGGKKAKIKIDPLPFHQLVRGTPLIATVYSPSGGVGKSSTAMNLGVYIAHVARTMARDRSKSAGEEVHVPRVLILDGDIVQGSLALRLKNQLEPSIHGLQLYIDERKSMGFSEEKAWPRYYETAPAGEKAMLDFVMWPDSLPNLNVLAAPPEPDLFFDLGEEEYRSILRMLGSFYDVIIIDSGTDIVLESQRSWLSHAHEVFIITVPELDRIYNARKAVAYMAKSRPHPEDVSSNPQMYPPLATSERISVVMSKYDADSGLDPEKLFKEFFPWLEERQKFRVPDLSSGMMRANNMNDFLVLQNSDYRSQLAAMAKYLFSRYAEARERRTMAPPAAGQIPDTVLPNQAAVQAQPQQVPAQVAAPPQMAQGGGMPQPGAVPGGVPGAPPGPQVPGLPPQGPPGALPPQG